MQGGDFRITTASGQTIDVSLEDCATLQDAIDQLNQTGGGAITAGLASTGNGLVITDNTTGGGTVKIEALNGSTALASLGLDVTASGNQLVGRDINPLRVDSPFTALLELQSGMQRDDRAALTQAGQRLDRIMKRMQEVQGEMASRARVMTTAPTGSRPRSRPRKRCSANVRDVDFADAAVRFQQLQTALEANLSTASKSA